jgi:hypothetical protein
MRAFLLVGSRSRPARGDSPHAAKSPILGICPSAVRDLAIANLVLNRSRLRSFKKLQWGETPTGHWCVSAYGTWPEVDF